MNKGMTVREEMAFPKLSIDLDENCEEHGLGVRLLGLNPFCHLLPIKQWTNYSPLLYLHVFLCKIELIIVCHKGVGITWATLVKIEQHLCKIGCQ